MTQQNNSELSLYKVYGDDAQTFLQGQLTQDVSTVSDEWGYAAHCNPKGRVLSLFMIFSNGDDYYLATPSELAEQAIMGVKKYVMRSKVTFEQLDYSTQFNDDDATKAEQNSFEVSDTSISLTFKNGSKLLFSEAHSQTAGDWSKTRIETGVPRLYSSTLAEFTPEELNLDLTGAISFTKGCYTGQEIVARMHYLGKAKKRLFKLGLTQSAKVGDEVSDLDGKAVGVIVDTTADTENEDFFALACLKSSCVNDGNETCLVNSESASIIQ